MFPSHQHEIGAIAFQLLASLDEYEVGMDQLVHEAWDGALYQSTTDCFDRMRNYAGAMPRLSAAWIELLIRRFELMAHLWERMGSSERTDRFAELSPNHIDAIRGLRTQVLRYLPKSS
ncbi:hypothetical protein FN976_01110 [Caenimonas sedimenti]|uniref:Uncharacterized protein n=1 Tax=Caenimonas sedimenti TaxID=2596921 RepID=A0A562ZXK2_9BURK|nr:hypothetical protein [Caenimonas sedimenti]TWO72874.1 hypothetical protein FN976_01110 [Caenimonas sedimenti]